VTGTIHATTRRSKRLDGILKQTCGGVLKIIAVICEYLVRLLDYRGLMGNPALLLLNKAKMPSRSVISITGKVEPADSLAVDNKNIFF
jgi:hypothetical protein